MATRKQAAIALAVGTGLTVGVLLAARKAEAKPLPAPAPAPEPTPIPSIPTEAQMLAASSLEILSEYFDIVVQAYQAEQISVDTYLMLDAAYEKRYDELITPTPTPPLPRTTITRWHTRKEEYVTEDVVWNPALGKWTYPGGAPPYTQPPRPVGW